MSAIERWPPSYDESGLAKTIRDIKQSSGAQGQYYQTNSGLGDVCQGDVFELDSKIPVIGQSGAPATTQADTKFWVVLGNTCDFSRTTVNWMSICPVFDLGRVGHDKLQAVREYETSRFYYIKPWNREVCTTLAADLTQTVCISKLAIVGHGQRHARLGYESWLLLNCCLVRFLARNDGRLD